MALVADGVPSGAPSALLCVISADKGLCLGLAAGVLRYDAKEQADLASEQVHSGVNFATCAAQFHGECERSSGRSWANSLCNSCFQSLELCLGAMADLAAIEGSREDHGSDCLDFLCMGDRKISQPSYPCCGFLQSTCKSDVVMCIVEADMCTKIPEVIDNLDGKVLLWVCVCGGGCAGWGVGRQQRSLHPGHSYPARKHLSSSCCCGSCAGMCVGYGWLGGWPLDGAKSGSCC